MTVYCLEKVRDNQGKIKYYNLEREDGFKFQATSQEIKEEIKNGNFECINLQIDKAGRLVDKKESDYIMKVFGHTVQPKEEENSTLYTMEDLVYENEGKGKTVMVYDPGTEKEYLTEIESITSWRRCYSRLENYLRVYCSELHSSCIVRIQPRKDDLEEDFKKEKESIEREQEQELDFLKDSKEKYDLVLKIGVKNIVDAEPNPKGEYTLVKLGITADTGDDESNIRYFKVKSSFVNGWIREDDERFKIEENNNVFNNIEIKRGQYVIPSSIPHVDVTQKAFVHMGIERNLNKLINKLLDDGGYGYYCLDDLYYDEDEYSEIINKWHGFMAWRESNIGKTYDILNKMEKQIKKLELAYDIHEMLDNTIDEISEKRVIYCGSMNDGYNYYSNTICSCNEEQVIEYLTGHYKEYLFNGYEIDNNILAHVKGLIHMKKFVCKDKRENYMFFNDEEINEYIKGDGLSTRYMAEALDKDRKEEYEYEKHLAEALDMAKKEILEYKGIKEIGINPELEDVLKKYQEIPSSVKKYLMNNNDLYDNKLKIDFGKKDMSFSRKFTYINLVDDTVVEDKEYCKAHDSIIVYSSLVEYLNIKYGMSTNSQLEQILNNAVFILPDSSRYKLNLLYCAEEK